MGKNGGWEPAKGCVGVAPMPYAVQERCRGHWSLTHFTSWASEQLRGGCWMRWGRPGLSSVPGSPSLAQLPPPPPSMRGTGSVYLGSCGGSSGQASKWETKPDLRLGLPLPCPATAATASTPPRPVGLGAPRWTSERGGGQAWTQAQSDPSYMAPFQDWDLTGLEPSAGNTAPVLSLGLKVLRSSQNWFWDRVHHPFLSLHWISDCELSGAGNLSYIVFSVQRRPHWWCYVSNNNNNKK